MNAQGSVRTPQESRAEQASRRVDNLMLSWVTLLLLPLSFFLGFALAHIPYALFDREEGEPGPWWFDLLVGAIAVGVTWIPVGLSLLFGRRALLAVSRAAWIPVSVALVLTGGAVVLVVAGLFG